MWTAQHRGKEGKLTTLDDEEGSEETHLLLQLAGDVARREEEKSSNGIVGTQLGGTDLALYRER
jgi:hypothetical protein